MKITLSLLLLLGVIYNTEGQEYSLTERYNDSLLIHDTYEISYKKFLAIKNESDRIAWQQFNDQCNERVACALNRLRIFNHSSYQPLEKKSRDQIGESLRYPNPSLHTSAGKTIEIMKQQFRYIIIDEQTRFMVDSIKRQRGIPYITKIVYDRGRAFSIQKLDPVTRTPLDSMQLIK
jgi:hypothetical protein